MHANNVNLIKLLFFLILFFFFALQNPAISDDECPFDQENQIEVLKQLQNKYQNSELIENKRKLIIPRGNAKIYFERGGCEHIGLSIKYVTTENANYANKEILLNKAEELLEEFGQEFISINEFRGLIKNNQYKLLQEGNPKIYIFYYEHLTSFEVIYSRENYKNIIEIAYYW